MPALCLACEPHLLDIYGGHSVIWCLRDNDHHTYRSANLAHWYQIFFMSLLESPHFALETIIVLLAEKVTKNLSMRFAYSNLKNWTQDPYKNDQKSFLYTSIGKMKLQKQSSLSVEPRTSKQRIALLDAQNNSSHRSTNFIANNVFARTGATKVIRNPLNSWESKIHSPTASRRSKIHQIQHVP